MRMLTLCFLLSLLSDVTATATATSSSVGNPNETYVSFVFTRSRDDQNAHLSCLFHSTLHASDAKTKLQLMSNLQTKLLALACNAERKAHIVFWLLLANLFTYSPYSLIHLLQ